MYSKIVTLKTKVDGRKKLPLQQKKVNRQKTINRHNIHLVTTNTFGFEKY